MQFPDRQVYSAELARLGLEPGWLEAGLPWLPINRVMVRLEVSPRGAAVPRSVIRHTLTSFQGEPAIRVNEVWCSTIDAMSCLLTNPFQALPSKPDPRSAHPLFLAYLPQTPDGGGTQTIFCEPVLGFPTIEQVPFGLETLRGYPLGQSTFPILRQLKYETPLFLQLKDGAVRESGLSRTLFIAPDMGLVREIGSWINYEFGKRVPDDRRTRIYERRFLEDCPEMRPFADVAFRRPSRMEFFESLVREGICAPGLSVLQSGAIREVFGLVLEITVAEPSVSYLARVDLIQRLVDTNISYSDALAILEHAEHLARPV